MKSRTWLLIIIIVLVVLTAIGAVWQFFLQSPPPPPSPAGLTEAPAPEVKALSWEELRSGVDEMEPLDLRQHGVRLFQQGDPDKAFLMFKTAARKGDGWSALAVGEMYDPATFAAADFNSKRTAFSKPNPGKALEWYDRALAQGEARARPLRNTLITYLEQAAANGDSKARKLLQKSNQ
jgi:hypothetical protein